MRGAGEERGSSGRRTLRCGGGEPWGYRCCWCYCRLWCGVEAKKCFTVASSVGWLEAGAGLRWSRLEQGLESGMRAEFFWMLVALDGPAVFRRRIRCALLVFLPCLSPRSGRWRQGPSWLSLKLSPFTAVTECRLASPPLCPLAWKTCPCPPFSFAVAPMSQNARSPPPPLLFLLFVGPVRCAAVRCVQTMSAMLNLIASIWESILPALQKSVNEPSLQLVQQTVTGEFHNPSPPPRCLHTSRRTYAWYCMASSLHQSTVQ